MNPDAFRCKPIGFIQKLPVQKEMSPDWMRLQYTEQYYEYANYSARNAEQDWNLDSLHTREDTYTNRINADEVLNYIQSVNKNNCQKRLNAGDPLKLKGDISYGADVHFKNEAQMAVR